MLIDIKPLISFFDDERRYLFATQIIEHNAYSLIIRVIKGLKKSAHFGLLSNDRAY